MELIAQLIESALWECYELGTVDWYADERPAIGEVFAECYIGRNPLTCDAWVHLLNVTSLIDLDTMQCWHSSKIEVEA